MLMHHPDVQTKVHEELDSVANGRKFIYLNDKVRVPVTTNSFSKIVYDKNAFQSMPYLLL